MQAARGASLSDGQHRPPRRHVAVVLSVCAAVVAVDAISKVVAVDRLQSRDPIELLGGFLTLRLIRNSGAAFGFAQGATVVFTCVAAVVVLIILRAARRLGSTGWAVALGLVLGGAVGNLLDRLFREPGPLRGHVVDFLELPHWPIFNLADSAIVSGGVLMVLLSLLGVQRDGTRHRPQGGPGGQPDADEVNKGS